MKKILVGLLAVLLIFSCFSCSSGKKVKAEPDSFTSDSNKKDSGSSRPMGTADDMITEPGMVVVDDNSGLNDAMTDHDKSNRDEAERWKINHNDIIKKNLNSITSKDLNAIQNALNDYEKLSSGAKALVQDEYKDLLNKLARAKAGDSGNTLTGNQNGNGKTAMNLTRSHLVLDNAQYYTVRRGDMLILIARRFYGREYENYFPVIIAATEDVIEDPDEIEPGQQLTIPELKAVLSTKESKDYVRQTFYDVAKKYDAKGKPGMASQLRAIAAKL